MWERDPHFSSALVEAYAKGVKINCITLNISKSEITFNEEISLNLESVTKKLVKIITDFRNKIYYIPFLLFISCAAIMSPPGGLKDETPPELISTVPKNRATNYNGNQIELIFSEYIDENSIKDAITILPNLEEEPIIKYKGKKIQIIFEGSLENNQTYIVVINRKLSDERKVKLSQGIQFAFSTGNKIDNGSISGRIYNSKNSSVQLWKIKDKIDSLDFYKRIPDYSIDASDSGQYNLNFYLREIIVLSLWIILYPDYQLYQKTCYMDYIGNQLLV